MTLVDSNVLLDVIQDDPNWGDWSSAELAKALDRGPVIVNPVIFAEVALAFDSQEELERYFRPSEYIRRELPWKAAMLVAKAFLRYRRSGGTKSCPLPDFYIRRAGADRKANIAYSRSSAVSDVFSGGAIDHARKRRGLKRRGSTLKRRDERQRRKRAWKKFSSGKPQSNPGVSPHIRPQQHRSRRADAPPAVTFAAVRLHFPL
jgi:predicted nucleic acid-binding protein